MPYSQGKQPAYKQPTHRRPSWARTETIYNANIAHATPRPYGPRRDYGLDNFSYDKTHLAQFDDLPDGILPVLSPELRRATSTWMQAAAAVSTSLARIDMLDNDAVVYTGRKYSTSTTVSFSTWPSASSPPIAPVDSGLGTPFTTSPPQSFDASIAAPIAKHPYPCHLPSHILGMDSPPYTPAITPCGVNTPANSTRALENDTLLDPLSLDVHLEPLSSAESAFSPITDSDDLEAEKAWESYAKVYNAEVYDLHHNSFPRFAGLDRRVNKLLIELEVDDDEDDDQQEDAAERLIAIARFRRWWRGHRGKVERYRELVNAVQAKAPPEC